MTSIEDKIMGYKTQNYVSSSESDGENSDSGGSDTEKGNRRASPAAGSTVAGTVHVPIGRTGPKGVIEDFRRYKQLEIQQKQDQDKQLQKLAKEFSLSCQSSLDEAKEKAIMELDSEEDAFLQQYHMKRLLQMKEEQEKKISTSRPQFGKLLQITGKEFVEAIDEEKTNVTVVVHLYDEELQSCRAMNDCLATLAQCFIMVKFCKVAASETGISKHFRERGLPALLVYRDGQLIGNFVRLEDIFSEDFNASDVESFLIETGVFSGAERLYGKRKQQVHTGSESDSDLELD